ncbi:transposase [Actinomadura madurae]
MKEIVLVPKPYPPEFRRRALELLESGRSVRDMAASLSIAESCLHRWKRRDLIDVVSVCRSTATGQSACTANCSPATSPSPVVWLTSESTLTYCCRLSEKGLLNRVGCSIAPCAWTTWQRDIA